MSSKRTAQQAPNQLQRKLLAGVVAACFIGAVHANPTAPQVVAGQASFNQQGNLFSITNTPNTIINWQSFSIGAGDITRFIQQNSDSKVLNRITGQDPSQILGALQSNGKVFLINPNGVMFGAGSRVDVNGLVASSLNISDADFLAGKNNFIGSASAGKVSNQGTITTPGGGQVYLIAPNVENSGIITSPNGDIVLAAGESVRLVDSSNPDVQVQVSAPADQALNLGQIVAQGGRVGIYGALVNQRGRISADSAVRGDAGQIILKASGTTLLEAGSSTSATGVNGAGGGIELLGQQVGLTGNAKVDASGATGGGSVLVGGDRQGLNPAVQNARASFVGSDAVISADAVNSGNGGKVIVWSDDATRMYGAISARGGATGGDGGFVETSGHYLDVNGARVNTTAHGQVGQWLLDPWDLTVVTSGGTAALADVAEFDSSTSGTTLINASTINAATSNVTLSAGHDLTINSGITLASNLSLTGQAMHDIVINAPVTTSSGSITLMANEGGGGGKIVSNANQGGVFGDIESGGGVISLNADSVVLQAPLNSGSGTLLIQTTSNTGAITLAAGGTGISAASANIAGGPIAINGHLVVIGELDLNSGSAAITSNSNALIGATAVHADGGAVTLANLTSITNTVSLTGSASSGDFTASAAGGIFIADDTGFGITSSSAIRLTAGGLGISEDSSSRVSAPILQLTTPGAVSLPASASNQIGALEGTSLGSLTYSQDSSATLTLGGEGRGVSVVGGDQQLSVTTGGALNVVKDVNSGGNALYLTGATIHIGSNATVTGSDTTELTGNGAGLLGNNGSITIDSGSQLLGNHIDLKSNQIILNGTVTATRLGSDDPSSVTLQPSSGSRPVVIGANAADVAADSDGAGGMLGLSQADLLNISADQLSIGVSNPNGDTGLLTMNGALNLGASSTKIGSLFLQGNGVILSSSLTTGADLTVTAGNGISNAGTLSAPTLTFHANSITNSGTLSANTLTLSADQITLGTINASSGTGTVNINTVGESTAIEFSGANPTDTGALHFNVADLANVNAGTLNFSAYSVSVLSPIALSHSNLSFSSFGFFGANSGPAFDVEALVTGKAVSMNSAGDMLINGGVSGTTVALHAGVDQPSTLTVAAPVTGSVVANLRAYRTIDIAAGGSVSAPSVSLTALDGDDSPSNLTVAGNVTGTGASGHVSLSGETILVDTTGLVSAPLVALSATPGVDVDTMGSVTVAGQVIGSGSSGAASLIGHTLLVSAGGVVSGPTVGLSSSDGGSVTVSGSVTGSGSSGAASLTGHTLLVNAGGVVSGPTVGLSSSDGGSVTVSGQVTGSGSGGTASLIGHTLLVSAGGVVSGQTVGLSSPDGGAVTVAGNITGTGSHADVALSGGSLAIASGSNVSAGTGGNLDLRGDAITLGADVVAGLAAIEPYTVGRTITLGSSSCVDINTSCLAFNDLVHVKAPTIGIGASGTTDVAAGNIIVVALTHGTNATTDHNITTTRIGLLSGGSVTQVGVVDVDDLGIVAGGAVTLNNPGNNISNLAVSQYSLVPSAPNTGDLSFTNDQSLTIARLTGSLNNGTLYDVNGISSLGNVTLNVTGALTRASGGLATDAVVKAASLTVTSTAGVGTTTQPLLTNIKTLNVTNTEASGSDPINIQNVDQPGTSNGVTPLSVPMVTQVGSGNHGAIHLDNTGEMDIGVSGLASSTGVISVDGNITLQTHSPMTVYGEVQSSGGNISLSAGPGGANDTLTLESGSLIKTISGTIALVAGDAIDVQGGTLTGTQLPSQSGINAANAGPTLSACIVNPLTPGCSSVLPPLSSCITNPTAQGCSVVLPTLAQCTTNPMAQGCSVVLPTLGSCTANPTAPGCSAVLPTLGSCTANPTAPGCSAVLPTLGSCTVNPTAPGCSAVLPTLASCAVNPTQSGCSVVLPTLASCTTNPTQSGCSVVLPTLASCLAHPTAAGCSAVFPSLTACVATPNLPGCSQVLPTLATCSATPSLAGCSAVLPSLASCVANPAATGCAAVLPSLASCVANPAAAGCATVLPSLVQCESSPTLAGCSAVLPSLASCSSNPNLAGCTAVLPTGTNSDQCALTPSLALCQVLAPPSQSDPVKPVMVALNQTIQLVSNVGPGARTSILPPASPSSPSSPSGGGGSSSTSSSTGGNAPTSTNPGVSNEPAKKMYCN